MPVPWNVPLGVGPVPGRRGGREIRRIFEGPLEAGIHAFPWDGRNDAGDVAAAGVYLARISTQRGVAACILVPAA